MADIHEAIYTQLTGFAGLAALISTRAYPKMLPQSPTLPAVVYQIVGNDRLERHRGASGDARPRVQVTAWAASDLGVRAVGTQVRLALTGMSGTVGGVVIRGARNDGEEIDVYEPDTKRHGLVLGFLIDHLEAA